MKEMKNGAKTKQVSPLFEIGRRLSAVLNEVGTRRKAAIVVERSTDQLTKYERGAVQPPFTAIARLCIATGVRMEWLATGQGERKSAGERKSTGAVAEPVSQPMRLDHGKLRMAAHVLEQALDQAGASTDAAGRAELLAAIYELLEQGSAQDAAQRVVASMLRAASKAAAIPLKQG